MKSFFLSASPLRSNFGIAQSVFTRGLGLIYLIAIISWWTQVDGLVGSNGVTPAKLFTRAVADHYGYAALWHTPTLLLFNPSDTAIHMLCLCGSLFAVLTIVGFYQGPSLAASWLIYLSLVTTGNAFMSFQWDALLLEAGLLAILFAPWRMWTPLRNLSDHAPRMVVFLLWFLVFKLMFLSGFVKIASLDRSWWAPQLNALTFHYETQPIAHVGAYWAHQLPLWIQKVSVIITYIIEMGLPFLIFLGRKPRLIAFSGFTLLMILIMATGNYTYFNLLTILICIPLLDDRLWPRFVRERIFKMKDESESDAAEGTEAPTKNPPKRWVWFGARAAVGVPIFLISCSILFSDVVNGIARIATDDPSKAPIKMRTPIPQFHVCNSYGLFRVMTKERPEIIIEGSYDGRIWREYNFKYKPDRLQEMPPFVAPHQPRLDWQMWFAALTYQYRGGRTQWFENLMARLLDGEPAVLQLMEENPFPERPPTYLRAR
ncbi:MAG: lipase maturation factor family protein, partial [Verrucomicrobiota bacterium]